MLDGKNLDQWNQVGGSNWHIAEGAVIADQMADKGAGYLVSKKSYKNFIVRVEFWPSTTPTAESISAASIQEDHRPHLLRGQYLRRAPGPSYGTGAITRYVEVNPMPKAGGKWNTYEITVKGRDITVVLNGQETAKLRNGMFDEGPIVLQHGAGAIKFRKVEVKPL